MNARQTIFDAIVKIAPDVDPTTLPDDVDFREEAELDSMDFLAVLTAVHEATGVSVPETDYSEIVTIERFADYLTVRLQPVDH
jgi:acyl carrier protein